MHRSARLPLAALALGALLLMGRPAAAQDEAKPLIVGATRLFTVRSGDTLNGRTQSVQDRLNHVHDVLPRHLGGQMGKFTTKKWGERVHIYLNGDFILAVTPEDARGTGYKSAEQLAPIWVAGLEKGFREAHSGNPNK